MGLPNETNETNETLTDSGCSNQGQIQNHIAGNTNQNHNMQVTDLLSCQDVREPFHVPNINDNFSA
jgi:hypothetical protein